MAINETWSAKITLTGRTEVMFDRYVSNEAKLSWSEILYLDQGNLVCLPSLNLISFLTAVNTESAAKLLLPPRTFRKTAGALLASVEIRPNMIPFVRDGKPIVLDAERFSVTGHDPKAKVQIVRHVARLRDGIPNPKERPVLQLPWALSFDMTVLPHPDLDIGTIKQLMVEGGLRLGIGTFRKRFGKFDVSFA